MYINPTGKIARHFDRLDAWKHGRIFAPIGVEIDLSNRCNLGCKFCHFAYTHTRGPLARKDDARYKDMGDLIEFSVLQRALKEMAAFGVRSVTYTGGGEPTLHPRFIECLKAARDYGFEIGMYTNGTLITQDMAEAIKQYCSWVVVSLDEPYHDEYRAIKQVDAFNGALRGIGLLSGTTGQAVIGVSFLVTHHHSLEDMRRMHEVGIRAGANYIEYRPRILFDENNPGKPDEDTEWVNAAIEKLNTLAKHFDKIDARIEQFKMYADYRRDYGVCNGILFTGIITPNGKLWKCVNRRGFADSCIGDLNEESFASIWARQIAHTDFEKCRVLCRADVINRKLWELSTPIEHANFV
jgi:MoaA/NifB/PqqE/SkfB family radical SAM enzyme